MDIKEQNKALSALRKCNIKIISGIIYIPDNQLSQPVIDSINILLDTGLFNLSGEIK